MTPEQTQEIIKWRELKLSPKEIARQMGLRPAEVTAFLRDYNENHPVEKVLPPLMVCLANSSLVKLLQPPQRHKLSWLGSKESLDLDDGKGLGEVIVVRMENHRYVISCYLIDYWCLGVKDTMLKKGDRQKYELLLAKMRQMFGEALEEISLEQAQALVFGAVDYAASLGFQPHADFDKTQPFLGSRLDHLQKIEFGKDGKPFYFCGPYDDQAKILRTLREHVGDGNFEFVAGGF